MTIKIQTLVEFLLCCLIAENKPFSGPQAKTVKPLINSEKEVIKISDYIKTIYFPFKESLLHLMNQQNIFISFLNKQFLCNTII